MARPGRAEGLRVSAGRRPPGAPLVSRAFSGPSGPAACGRARLGPRALGGRGRAGGRVSGGRFLPAAEDAVGSGLAVGPRGSKLVGGPGALQRRKIKDNPCGVGVLRLGRSTKFVLYHSMTLVFIVLWL